MDIKIKLYEIVDNFLTEAKDQYWKNKIKNHWIIIGL